MRGRRVSTVTAEAVYDVPDPDDPAEILRRLPARWQGQFLGEYRAGLDAAREVQQWHRLRDLLHRWRLRAAAYSDPEFERSAQVARDARPEELTTLPGWPDLR